MFHDKRRANWQRTAHHNHGLIAPMRLAVSGDDPSRICCARCGTSAASRSRRSRIIVVRYVRFSPGRLRAHVPGPRPRSRTCPRIWRVGHAGVARRSRFMCRVCVRSFDTVPRVVGAGQGLRRRSRPRACTRTSGCPKAPNGARCNGSSMPTVATPPPRSATTRCWFCWRCTAFAPARCAA
jgi:hypothetical protein